MDREIRNPHDERLAYTFTPGAGRDRAVVVIGHGVTSDRTRPWSVALSEELARRDLASLRVAFSGNGESEGRFEHSNITKELDDLAAVVDALGEHAVAYVGHSMGGAVGCLFAARDDRLRSLVSLAAIAHTRAFVERLFGHLVPGRDVMLEKDHCPLTQAFVDDLTAIGSVVDAARAVQVPWLVVHGDADEIVPVSDSEDVHAAQPNSELVVLEGVDHSFTGAGLGAMTSVVAGWLDTALD